ncbi:MAG: hypothetical protein WDO68_21410 [Gammaproteobacteria bacterium]
MEWSNNNAACVTTWSVLRLLEEVPVNTTFVKCGGLKVSDLRFFGADASPEMLDFQAKSLAASLDSIFRNIRKAVFEKGVKQADARSAMAKGLKDGTNTLPEFAEIIDNSYVFLLETKS